MGKGRLVETNIEEMRRSVGKNIPNASRSNSATALRRFVDAKAITGARIKDYGAWNNGVRKIHTTSHGEAYENTRNWYGSGFHIGEIPLGMCLEELYFKTYGEGFDGTDVPPKIGEGYTCWRCGQRYEMPIIAMSKILECHRCKTETPMGRLVRDGHYKR